MLSLLRHSAERFRDQQFSRFPAFGVRLAFGEMADALLLSSERVEPERLKAAGYQFKYSQLEEALRHALGEGLVSCF